MPALNPATNCVDFEGGCDEIFAVPLRNTVTTAHEALHSTMQRGRTSFPNGRRKQSAAVAVAVIIFLLVLCSATLKKGHIIGWRENNTLARGSVGDMCISSTYDNESEKAQEHGPAAATLGAEWQQRTHTTGEGRRSSFPARDGGGQETQVNHKGDSFEETEASPTTSDGKTASCTGPTGDHDEASASRRRAQHEVQGEMDPEEGSTTESARSGDANDNQGPSARRKSSNLRASARESSNAQSGKRDEATPSSPAQTLQYFLNGVRAAELLYTGSLKKISSSPDVYEQPASSASLEDPELQPLFDDLFLSLEYLRQLVPDVRAQILHYQMQREENISPSSENRRRHHATQMLRQLRSAELILASNAVSGTAASKRRSSEAMKFSRSKRFLDQMRVYCIGMQFLQQHSSTEDLIQQLLDMDAAAAAPEAAVAENAAGRPELLARGAPDPTMLRRATAALLRLKELQKEGDQLLRTINQMLTSGSARNFMGDFRLLDTLLRVHIAMDEVRSRLAHAAAAAAASGLTLEDLHRTLHGTAEAGSGASGTSGSSTVRAHRRRGSRGWADNGASLRVGDLLTRDAIDTTTRSGAVITACNYVRMSSLGLAMIVKNGQQFLERHEPPALAQAPAEATPPAALASSLPLLQMQNIAERHERDADESVGELHAELLLTDANARPETDAGESEGPAQTVESKQDVAERHEAAAEGTTEPTQADRSLQVEAELRASYAEESSSRARAQLSMSEVDGRSEAITRELKERSQSVPPLQNVLQSTGANDQELLARERAERDRLQLMDELRDALEESGILARMSQALLRDPDDVSTNNEDGDSQDNGRDAGIVGQGDEGRGVEGEYSSGHCAPCEVGGKSRIAPGNAQNSGLESGRRETIDETDSDSDFASIGGVSSDEEEGNDNSGGSNGCRAQGSGGSNGCDNSKGGGSTSSDGYANNTEFENVRSDGGGSDIRACGDHLDREYSDCGPSIASTAYTRAQTPSSDSFCRGGVDKETEDDDSVVDEGLESRNAGHDSINGNGILGGVEGNHRQNRDMRTSNSFSEGASNDTTNDHENGGDDMYEYGTNEGYTNSGDDTDNPEEGAFARSGGDNIDDEGNTSTEENANGTENGPADNNGSATAHVCVAGGCSPDSESVNPGGAEGENNNGDDPASDHDNNSGNGTPGNIPGQLRVQLLAALENLRLLRHLARDVLNRLEAFDLGLWLSVGESNQLTIR